MASNLEVFLKEWKVLESSMRENGLEVREWEEQHIGEVEAERLKVCRIIRNYITHNPTESFIDRLDNMMIKWVKQFAKSLKPKKKSNKVLSKAKPVIKRTVSEKLANNRFVDKKKSEKETGNKTSAKNKKQVVKRSVKVIKSTNNKKMHKKLMKRISRGTSGKLRKN